MKMQWMLIVLLVAGCGPPADYNGYCTVEKIDGKVLHVDVGMPRPSGNTNGGEIHWTIQTREEMDELIEGTESLLIDLKEARDQMPVIEKMETIE